MSLEKSPDRGATAWNSLLAHRRNDLVQGQNRFSTPTLIRPDSNFGHEGHFRGRRFVPGFGDGFYDYDYGCGYGYPYYTAYSCYPPSYY
jgi:hypothetical protein